MNRGSAGACTATTLTAELRGRDYAISDSDAPRLVIVAVPQPEGGVKMKVRAPTAKVYASGKGCGRCGRRVYP